MSAIQYAVKLKCDYPGCQSIGDAADRDRPPPGWLVLRRPYMPDVRDPFGVDLSDFCTLHAEVPLSTLALAIEAAVMPK